MHWGKAAITDRTFDGGGQETVALDSRGQLQHIINGRSDFGISEPMSHVILALRLELVSSLPDCRGLFAVIRVHVVMPGRRARALTSDLYCCVSIDRSLDIVHPL